MKIIKPGFIILLICNSFFAAEFSVEKGWKGILPIANTRADVEKLLGKPNEVNGNYVFYDMEDAAFSIAYSDAPCTKTSFGEWNVPRDTILNYSVGIKKGIYLEDIGLNKIEFSRNDKHQIGDRVSYYSAKKHISLYTEILENKKEVLANLFYYPAEWYQNLKCP